MTSSEGSRPPASGTQIAKGAAWLMLFKLADKGVGVISTLILARVLVPADFGLVAMATAVFAFTQLMGAFGFDSALIQRQDARRQHFDTAWTFAVIFGVLIAATLAALAVPMARFYGDDRLVAIILVLAAGAVVSGFQNVGTVAFRKELDFRSEFRFLFSTRIAAFLVTVGLALSLRSYWALVLGSVTGRLLTVMFSYQLHPYRPRFSLTARADLMHFSKWIFLSSLISFFSQRSTDFILGRTVGSHGLGLYNIAWEIASMPSTEMIAPLNRAVFPAYARLAADFPELQKRFLEVFGMICLLAFPVCAGLFACADAAVRVVLGVKWVETIPLMQIFALTGLVGALQSNLYLVIVAMGKPQANTLLSGALLLLSLPITIWASLTHGTVGAAYAVLFASLMGVVGITVVFRRITRIGIGPLARAAWRPAAASAAMLFAMMWLDSTSTLVSAQTTAAHLARALAMAVLGAVTYVGAVWLLWRLSGAPPGAEGAVHQATTRVWARMRRAAPT